MKLKNSKRIFFVGAILFDFIILLCVLCKPLMIQSAAEKNNKIIRLKCSLYDPFDPMKGRYVRLDFEETRAKVSDIHVSESFFNNKNGKTSRADFPSVYAIFQNDVKGFSKLKEITLEKPEESKVYIKTPAHYYGNNDEIVLEVNFNKYYMQEEKAEKLDKMSNSEFKKMNTFLEVWVNNKGEAIQKALFLNESVQSD